ncbi:uncharacterized protein LOC114522997 [Dendronephthya gigantea]|uniref:uncharacterized protein LOC114522997 n=1 Tax=Dendronephthya gigantea TaxID=151771 RepID=UPI00106A0FA5|nr:uncharacterized protein LOC114522997 [Dendronephthya gigantea]XP_028399590.1 uncharacterized protein LOC114522997 [Dendronephthya gigantea]XP_028399591.1 uncharacterized protein LOC114522997 [Dendronephthya gigantea]
MEIGGTYVVIMLCLLLSLHGRDGTKGESGNDNLYQEILQEYKNMLDEITMYSGFGPVGSRTSCQNSCHVPLTKMERSKKSDECHCDKHCIAFGDCCLDYWQSCNVSFLKTIGNSRQFECLVPTLKLSNRTKRPRKIGGHEVITKCPKSFYDSKMKRKCENPVSYESGPFVEGKDGRTYRNEDCARCNGVKNRVTWNTGLACDKSTFDLIKERLENRHFNFTEEEREMIRNSCDVEMSPPDKSTTFQCKIVAECQNKIHPDYSKCLLYKQEVGSYNFQTYKNPHCAKCSGILMFQLFFRRMASKDDKKSLAILFDFSKASQIYGSEEEIAACPKDELYDSEEKACRKPQYDVRRLKLLNWTCLFMNETFSNSSQHIVQYENGSVFISSHQRVYEPKDYHRHGENITVCGNFTKYFLKTTKTSTTQLFSTAEFNLTVVGYTSSIISLLLVLITYFLFSELRTLPGKMTICLAIALLFSQLFFLVDIFGDFSGSLCKGIAIILHYLYLASFSWMTVLAYDVAKTFTSNGRRSQTHREQRIFLLCSLYAWGLPLLLVGLALCMENTGVIDISYGNAYYCWITNQVSLVIFFITPVMIMILFNIVALVLVLTLIRRERKITKRVIYRSTTKQDFSVCWKLTTVFGITWVLGLGVPYHVALRIAFILLNSLQGFFLMVGFIMTKRTLNLYLRMTGMGPLITRTGPTRSTMSSTKSFRRRRNSDNVLVKSKPAIKQQNPRSPAEEKNDVVIKYADPPGAAEKMKAIETTV